MKHKNVPMVPMVDVGLGKISSHTYATLSRFQSICNYAGLAGVRDIVVLGDIFHTPYPDVVTFSHFQSIFRVYPDVRLHIIPGNHDCDSHYSNVRALQLTSDIQTFFVQTMTRIGEHVVEIVPHMGYGADVVPNGGGGDDRVLLSHAQLEGLKVNGFELESTGSAMSLSQETAKKYGRVFLGHVHKPSRIRKKKSNLDVIYPGSLFPCTFGEIGDNKGFWDFTSDKFISFFDIPDVVYGGHQTGPNVCMGEVTIKGGKARINWGALKPTGGEDEMRIVKVHEFSEDRSSMSIDRTKEIMQRFSDRGLIVSSYIRTVQGRRDEIERLESIKGEINHEQLFNDYVDANYGDHKYHKIIKAAGRRMLERTV